MKFAVAYSEPNPVQKLVTGDLHFAVVNMNYRGRQELIGMFVNDESARSYIRHRLVAVQSVGLIDVDKGELVARYSYGAAQ